MSVLKVDMICPNCKRMTHKQVLYDDLGDPFVHKCDPAGGGCGKYFAVKLSLSLKAECCKIFEGVTSGESDRG